jgi:dihydrofolate reductase
MIEMIVAQDLNGLIGLDGQLPWGRIKGDMALFKALTMDTFVVMGRNTWDSLPTQHRPLKGRINVIVTTTMPEDSAAGLTDVHIVRSLEDALKLHKDLFPSKTFMCIGGATLYKAFLELETSEPKKIHLSLIKIMVGEGRATSLPNPVYRPKFNSANWLEVSRKVYDPEPNAPQGWIYICLESISKYRV